MPCLQFLEGYRCWEDGRGQKIIPESRDWGLTASLVPIFIESSCVDYGLFDFELVNTFTDGKDREIPRRVPAAQGLSLGHSSTSIPPRIAVTPHRQAPGPWPQRSWRHRPCERMAIAMIYSFICYMQRLHRCRFCKKVPCISGGG